MPPGFRPPCGRSERLPPTWCMDICSTRPTSANSRAAGVPLVLTIHNMRPGWPEGLETLARGDATLMVACARAVEDELAGHDRGEQSGFLGGTF